MTQSHDPSQNAKAGDHAIIIQAGRDALILIPKAPPDIKLIRMVIDDVEEHACLRQKINLILKNNGDKTAFVTEGLLVSEAHATINVCGHMGMQFSLSVADWTYDINIDDKRPSFVGRHSIAPNEVVNFDVMVGRKQGGYALTIYRCYLLFNFDEGESLQTAPFHLQISGPTVWNGGYQAFGPTPTQWGQCQADNIRRLDKIGYDYRPFIDEESRKYVEAVAPEIFNAMPDSDRR